MNWQRHISWEKNLSSVNKCAIATMLFTLIFGALYISDQHLGYLHPFTRTKVATQDLIIDQKTLIILTQIRSGSSFTGEIFAATDNSFYLYEPMYPFGLECDSYTTEKALLLKNILSCDFENLDSIYTQGFEKSNWDDSGPECRKRGLCFIDASTGLLTKYMKTCRDNTNQKNCGYPLKAEILKKACESSSLVLTKTTRMCTLENLESVYEGLKRKGKNVFVLHLVRDFRAILSSRLELLGENQTLPPRQVTSIWNSYCLPQRKNLAYIKQSPQGSNLVFDGRYMRVRYEDLTYDAVGTALKVFRFMGVSNTPTKVVDRIRNFLHPKRTVLRKNPQANDPFGVIRDPRNVLRKWRDTIPFQYVLNIQKECGDVLEEMGYRMFASEAELRNQSLPYFRSD